MKFWVGSSIRIPVRQLVPADLSLFDLNPEGGVGMTTLQDDAIAQAGPGGFLYQVKVTPAAVLQRNHRDFTVANFYAPLERLVLGSPDYQKVLKSRYAGNHKSLMKNLIGRGMLGAALDYVYAEFYVSKRRQFCVDVVKYLLFDGRFYKVDQSNLGTLSPDHPNHVEALPQIEMKQVKVFATIWNLGCVKVLSETQSKV